MKGFPRKQESLIGMYVLVNEAGEYIIYMGTAVRRKVCIPPEYGLYMVIFK